MSNKKQNSVDWYSNEIGKITALALSGKMTGLEWKYLQAKALEKAKEMHRQEIENAVDGFPIHTRHLNGEQYYNQTFNHEKVMKDIFKPVDNFQQPEVLEISVIINNCKHSIKIDKEDVLDSEDIDIAIQFLFELKPKLSF